MAIFFGTQGSITIDTVQSKNITEWSLSTSADVEQIKTIGNFTIFDEKPLGLLEGSKIILASLHLQQHLKIKPSKSLAIKRITDRIRFIFIQCGKP